MRENSREVLARDEIKNVKIENEDVHKIRFSIKHGNINKILKHLNKISSKPTKLQSLYLIFNISKHL